LSGFEVINGGILTLLQDTGRFGFASYGVSTSGAMDEYAYLYANKMLDNDLDTNVLEIAFSGLCLKATSDTMISVTGANITFSINDKVYSPWQTFTLYKGDVIRFSKNLNGLRGYLAVKGGFDIPKVFGSNATTLKEMLGGIDGRALKKGDFLPFQPHTYHYTKRLKKVFQPNYNDPLILRVLLGYQEEVFNEEEKRKFFDSTFEVSHEANRMGIKLEGESIIPSVSGVISEGITFGSIQIPSDGKPIVLLKDRQTMGGYAKIGSVLSIDCFKLSQAKPKTPIVFKPISLEEATLKVKAFYAQFH
jgi:biotin-dependent carboxylase-like uncharacterized protein